MQLTDVPVKLFAISGSPRANGNTQFLLDKAVEGSKSIGNVEVEVYSLAQKKLSGCVFCNGCKKNGTCIINDDFQDIFKKWLQADGLLVASPVFHMNVPSQLKAVMDRLGHVMFAHFNRFVPRFSKPGGVLAQGTATFGGQETTELMLIQHLLTMNCLPVTADKPNSYIGVAGVSPTWDKGSICGNNEAMETAFVLGRRVAEMAKVVKFGLDSMEDLPIEYDYVRLLQRGQ